MTTHSVLARCVLMLALIASGCQSGAVTEQDPERARLVLITALEAWKSGSPQSLTAQTPPIRLQDDDLMAGWQLVSYDLMKPKSLILPFNDVPVQLELRDLDGKPVRKTVSYQVGLAPLLTVQRSDN